MIVFVAASGAAQTGTQFIVFRAMQGIGTSMCSPTAISILTSQVPQGRARNIAFASLGAGVPIGFQIGLLLSGAIASVSWRAGFFLCAGFSGVFFLIACWCVPVDRARRYITIAGMLSSVDAIGIAISSTAMSLMLYFLS